MDKRPNGIGVFRREGEYWTIACDGRLIRLRHMKGLAYVARLLRAPGRNVSVDELSDSSHGPEAQPTDRRRVAVTKAIRTALRKIAENDLSIGERLEGTIRTGKFCSYEPGKDGPPRWED